MSGALREAARRELDNPAPVGQRHAQIVRLAPLLRADGLCRADIFHRLRAMYDAQSLPDTEISAVIDWSERKIPESRKNDFHPVKFASPNERKNLLRAGKNSESYFQQASRDFLQGFSFGEADFFDASPVKLPSDFRNDAELVFESLYFPSERLNVVTRFRDEKNNGKTSPLGFGEVLSRNEWIDSFRNKSIPQSQAGAWFRINPLNGNGITDKHVSAFRFALLESDFLLAEIQISLFSKLPIPICAIVTSGGKSLHAWVRIGATNEGEYREKVSELFFLLSPFGFDPSNKNPSRLSRLPGAQRTIGATGDGKQRLLYLNPDATERSIA